jgi:hypothetical protein
MEMRKQIDNGARMPEFFRLLVTSHRLFINGVVSLACMHAMHDLDRLGNDY